MAIEIELKLSIHEDHTALVGDQDVVKRHIQGPAVRRHLVSTYFDTPDLRLRSGGIGIRVRHQEGRYLQTVKTRGRAATGLHQRNEWEAEVAGNALDFSSIEDAALRRFFADPALQKSLQPVFTTEFVRTTHDLVFPDDSRIELAVDVGEIRAEKEGSASQTLPISEVELELKAGCVARLYETALDLSRSLPLSLLAVSKAESGCSLVDPDLRPLPKKVGPLNLTGDRNAEEAYQVILRHLLSHLCESRRVLGKDDSRSLHEMRVTLRRMRTCLDLYHPQIPRDSYRHLTRNIKWLASSLGRAREWDVFLDTTLKPILEANPDHHPLEEVRRTAAALRKQSYSQAYRALASMRFTSLVLGSGAWIEGHGWRKAANPAPLDSLGEAVGRFAERVLEGGHGNVLEPGKAIQDLTVEEWHRLRILCKVQRYAAEFFADLFPGEAMGAYIRRLVDLQNTLGVLNDGRTAGILATQLAPAEDLRGVKLLEDTLREAAHRHLLDSVRAWNRFTASHEEKPWRSS